MEGIMAWTEGYCYTRGSRVVTISLMMKFLSLCFMAFVLKYQSWVCYKSFSFMGHRLYRMHADNSSLYSKGLETEVNLPTSFPWLSISTWGTKQKTYQQSTMLFQRSPSFSSPWSLKE